MPDKDTPAQPGVKAGQWLEESRQMEATVKWSPRKRRRFKRIVHAAVQEHRDEILKLLMRGTEAAQAQGDNGNDSARDSTRGDRIRERQRR